MSSEARIEQLYFYPIKSFRGVRTSVLTMDQLGPLWDRQWLLVDENGRFLTQRQLPELAKIELNFDPDSCLELAAADAGSIDFGLNEHMGDLLKVVVWKAEMLAQEVSGEVSEWLSQVLQRKVRLVRMAEGNARTFKPEFPERHVRFVDGKPLLVISAASVADLERRVGHPLSVLRFRPNVVVSGVGAYAEDSWPEFTVGKVRFQAVEPCTRCKITTVHPLTGQVGDEPLKTLATYRRLERGIAFGHYYAHLTEGTIKIGERVSLHSKPLLA
jgi:uncharacterized protein YcbX